MSRISRVNLFDKDIRALAPLDKVYKKAVGNPKELYIKIYPSGMKTFFIQYKNMNYFKLKEFREGIYSVAKARCDAIEIIKKFNNGFIRSKDKYLLEYIEKKLDRLSKAYLDRVNSSIKEKLCTTNFLHQTNLGLKNGIDKRYAALTDKEELKEFLID